jgi:TatD DNase family protein
MIFDTHAHFNIPDDERLSEKDILKFQEGYFINNVGVDLISSFKAVELSKKYNFTTATVGIHPHECNNNFDIDNAIKELDSLITNNRKYIVGIGEVGLDTTFNKDYQAQVLCLKKQIDLAIKHNLVLNIHCRNLYDEIYEILNEYNNLKVIMHCFNGSLLQANRFIEKGFLISISGICTFKKAENLVELLKNISLSNIVIETDSPYLSPVPVRGKTNTPENLKYIIDFIASIKNVSPKIVEDYTFNNAAKFLNIIL